MWLEVVTATSGRPSSARQPLISARLARCDGASGPKLGIQRRSCVTNQYGGSVRIPLHHPFSATGLHSGTAPPPDRTRSIEPQPPPRAEGHFSPPCLFQRRRFPLRGRPLPSAHRGRSQQHSSEKILENPATSPFEEGTTCAATRRRGTALRNGPEKCRYARQPVESATQRNPSVTIEGGFGRLLSVVLVSQVEHFPRVIASLTS